MSTEITLGSVWWCCRPSIAREKAGDCDAVSPWQGVVAHAENDAYWLVPLKPPTSIVKYPDAASVCFAEDLWVSEADAIENYIQELHWEVGMLEAALRAKKGAIGEWHQKLECTRRTPISSPSDTASSE